LANQCEYYPCHNEPCIGFKCDYCYCPLYYTECESKGGKPKFIQLNKEELKDCSDCMLPHTPEFEIDLR